MKRINSEENKVNSSSRPVEAPVVYRKGVKYQQYSNMRCSDGKNERFPHDGSKITDWYPVFPEDFLITSVELSHCIALYFYLLR